MASSSPSRQTPKPSPKSALRSIEATLVSLRRASARSFGPVTIDGIMPVWPFDELRVDDWEAMVDVNLKGVLFGIAAALPVFRR